MIFKVFKLYKNIKQGSADPTGFARDEALGMLRTACIVPTIVFGLLLVLFFVLGFSNFWFGPSGFFQVISVLFSVVFLGWVALIKIIFSLASRMLTRTKKVVDARIYETDGTPRL